MLSHTVCLRTSVLCLGHVTVTLDAMSMCSCHLPQVSTVLAGKELCVVNGTPNLSKEEIERRIVQVRCGGEVWR